MAETNEIFGTSGDDQIIDSSESNTLYGLEGDDRLVGNDGDDTLLGGADRDTLLGRNGNDILRGGTGKDLLKGENGADTYLYELADLDGSRDTIVGFAIAEGDLLDLTAIVAAEGWTEAEALAALVFTDTSKGVNLDIVTSAGTLAVADIRGLSAADFQANPGVFVLEGAPPADTADDDGNLALTAPDTEIDADEMSAVEFTVSGLDAGSTAVITVSDGSSAIVSGTILADGTVTLDLSFLADGPLTSSITASASGEVPVTVSGPALTLDTDDSPPDTSADEDGNLALTAPDTAIDATEVTAVSFTISGLDADATAVITVSDGTTTVTSGVITADGTIVLDLSSLSGDDLSTTVTSTVTATDGALNTAQVNGPSLELTRALPPAGAEYGTEGADKMFASAETPSLFGLGGNDRLVGSAFDDLLNGGAGNDTLLGRNGNDILRGGAGKDILKGEGGDDTIVYELADLDGSRDTIVGFSLADDLLDLTAIVAAEGWSQSQAEAALVFTDTSKGVNLDIVTSSGTLAVADIRDLSAADLAANLQVFLLEGGDGPVEPDTADDDGNLALAAPDTEIDADEMSAVDFTLSGLDAGSSAVITISDGASSVSSGVLTANGTVTLDLSGLGDGPLTSEVTASASGAEDVTVSGPGLTLDTDDGGGAGGDGDTLSFAGSDEAMVVNLAAGTYATAAKVMLMGDSLTVGWVDGSEPDATREGYRLDLFENIVSAGGWIDYVGGGNHGPDGMLDTDHAAVSGIDLSEVTSSDDSVAGVADVSNAASTYKPDIAVMMLGTNDIGKAANFPVRTNGNDALSPVMNNLDKAVDQFFANADAGAVLVVSTIAPRIDRDRDAEASDFFNEGYSIVGGQPVAGDAGNGTYVPGLIATITGLQSTYPNLLLFENPHATYGNASEQTDHLSSDDIHWTQAAYAEFATALQSFLEDEFGLTAGTLDGTAQSIASGVTDLFGGNAGDRLTGDAGNNTIGGGGGSDLLEGGGGADAFVFDQSALDTGSFDRIADFDATEGDVVDISAIAAFLGLSANQARAALDLSATPDGVEVSLTDGGTTYHLATLTGLDLGDISLTDDFIVSGGTS